MVKSETQDFPFVEELPKREKSRFTKLWDHFEEMRACVRLNGLLIPVKLAADIAGVSRQRISELFELGILVRVEFHGHPFVTETSFLTWAKTERKAGRPLNLPTSTADKFRAGFGKARKASKNS
jgi:hypothetical protein